MIQVRWSDKARNDFAAAIRYIAEDNPQNAQIVRDRMLRTISMLESFSLGVPGPKGTLKLFVPKTPYFVIFKRNADESITLLTFLRTSRDWERFDWSKLSGPE